MNIIIISKMTSQAGSSPTCASIFKKLTRRKPCIPKQIADNDPGSKPKTSLRRALTTTDLTLLGIGSTIGIGMYVLSGLVAKTSAGPAVVISFFIAACTSVFSGLCYAEFASRVPSAGSAYAYSYAVIGEFVAFVVGWNMIIEYAIGVASVGRAYSSVIDALTGRKMISAFKECCSLHVSFLAEYFDFFGVFAVLVVTLLLAFGVKESAIFNNAFTCVNIAVVLFVLFVGSALSNADNWTQSKEEIILANPGIDPKTVGEGGFAPFGFQGILKGAASCFYAFVGFDSIASSAEEAKNPQKSIPRAIITSLFLVFLAYFGTSLVVTMMVPYYLQDSASPLAEAFAKVGFPPGKWIVTVGALCGFSSSLISAIYPMPRVIYSMASDGVIFKFMSKVHYKFRTPMVATFICGTFAALVSGLFDLTELIDMMSIGTLTAYTIVAVCVLCLRYRKTDESDEESDSFSCMKGIRQLLNLKCYQTPTEVSSKLSSILVFLFCIFSILLSALATFGHEEILNLDCLTITLLMILLTVVVLTLISLSLQPNENTILAFKVPLVPWIPGISIVANLFLMMKLSFATWVRFGGWMILGFIIYGICLFNGTTDKAYAENFSPLDTLQSSDPADKAIMNGPEGSTIETNSMTTVSEGTSSAGTFSNSSVQKK